MPDLYLTRKDIWDSVCQSWSASLASIVLGCVMNCLHRSVGFAGGLKSIKQS